MEKDAFDSTVICRFCNEKSDRITNWMVHVDNNECVIVNPCIWFPGLLINKSVNKAYNELKLIEEEDEIKRKREEERGILANVLSQEEEIPNLEDFLFNPEDQESIE